MRFSLRPLLLAAGAAATLLATAPVSAGTATVAGGCFWCVESDFESVNGVGDVVSGLTGGTTAAPVYGNSGDHIESVQIPFDDSRISYRQVLDLFFRSIDPLDAGGQFCDRGHAYTTAIFVDGPQQRAVAEAAKAAAEAELGQAIVTPILDASRFYPVDAGNQDYYKSDERLTFSSVGLAVPKKVAYKRYRANCGRDQRVRQVWGDAAPFVGGHS